MMNKNNKVKKMMKHKQRSEKRLRTQTAKWKKK